MTPPHPKPDADKDPSCLTGKTWWSARLLDLIAATTPTCREVTELVSRSLDEPLPWRVRLQLRLHFLICVWCHRYSRQLGQLRKVLHTLPDQIDCGANPGDEQGLGPEGKARLKERLRSGGGPR